MSRNVVFEGFVIKKQQILDSSYVVTFFSKSHGKVRMIAKGIKKITSKRASHLQTGNKIRWFASHHLSDAWYMGSTNLISGLSVIKDDSLKSNALYCTLQLLDILLPEEVPEKNVYSAFTMLLIRLAEDEIDTDKLIFGFADSLIDYLGFGKQEICSFSDLRKIVSQISGQDVTFATRVGQINAIAEDF